MAKKKVELENIELQPQIIGHTYKKKSNVGRIIFMLLILFAVVYYIDDVTIFINNLLGMQTSENIEDNANKHNVNLPDPNANKDVVEYKELADNISFQNNSLTFENFKYNNNQLTFQITNKTDNNIDLTNKKIFLETYDALEDKKLIDTYKIKIGIVKSNDNLSYTLNIKNNFKVISIVEKSIDSYPNVSLTPNSDGLATLSCTKNYDRIDYVFAGDSLKELTHSYSYNDINDANYQTELNNYQALVNNYQNKEGITANFNSTEYGFTATIKIDLEKANLDYINNDYYYGFKEKAKVVKYEMELNDFKCN